MPAHPIYSNRYILPLPGVHDPELLSLNAINPEDPPGKRLTIQAACKLARFFLEDPRHERGALIRTDFEVIPLTNGIATPAQTALFEMGDDREYDHLVNLAVKKQLWGWAHSHPVFDCIPSGIDLANHKFNCNMVIFSCVMMTFGIYSPQDLIELETERKTEWKSRSSEPVASARISAGY